MSAPHPFKFGEYELCPARAEDRQLAREWNEADPAHQGKISPDFWTEQGIAVDSYIFKDAEGKLFFIRMERVTRLYIQFGPTETKEQQQRMRAGLTNGLAWLAGALGRCSVGEVIFDSTNKLLRRFAIGSLGFSPAPETLSRRVRIVNDVVELPPITDEMMECVERAAGMPLPATF